MQAVEPWRACTAGGVPGSSRGGNERVEQDLQQHDPDLWLPAVAEQ